MSIAKKPVVKKTAAKKAAKAENAVERREGTYTYALGRRKRSIAQVRLFTVGGKGVMTVNGKPSSVYFPVFAQQAALVAPLKTVGLEDCDADITVKGGGLTGQSEAVRLGISRALIIINEGYRKPLKAEGFLMRDPREKERKKPGLKKARKGAQWAKR
jgi:small subunit ribosomal protein S9